MAERVIVNSLPKSGTNLVAKLLDISGYKHRFTIDSGLVKRKDSFQCLRNLLFRQYFNQNTYSVGIDMPVELGKQQVDCFLSSLFPQQYCLSHIGYSKNFLEMLKRKTIKMIIVTRDPRAVLNSSIHYFKNEISHQLYPYCSKLTSRELEEFALYGGRYKDLELRSLRERCDSVTPWIRDPSFLHVKFEELVGPNGGGTLSQQLKTIERIIQFLDIDKKNDSKYIAKNLFGKGRKTFRSGQIDAWKIELSPEIIKKCENSLDAQLSYWSYI